MSDNSEEVAATNRSEEPADTSDRSGWPTRLCRLSEQDDADVLAMSPTERIEMMWPLAVNAWAFMGVDVSGSQFQRHVERVIRRGG